MFEHLYSRGEAYCDRLRRFTRPLCIVAHHDDEISIAGLLQRLAAPCQIVWVTNSDGLYSESDLQPEAYGRLRMQEGLYSAERLGIPAADTRCLGWSEVEIYRRLSELHSGRSTVADVLPFFRTIREQVREAVLEIRPDVVLTLAWQGGQPEHDLVHFFTDLALQELQAETGVAAEYLQVPAYEYTILLAQRFHPLYRGTRMRIRLGETELACKLQMIEQYPSQVRLFGDFRKLFWVVGKLGRLIGGPRRIEDYLRTEEFGPVPAGLDYRRNTHWFEYFTYMFDHFEGVPVTFKRSIRPLVEALQPDPVNT